MIGGNGQSSNNGPGDPGGDARALLRRIGESDRSLALLLACVLTSANDSGVASLNDVAIAFRDRHLRLVRAEGRDAERESGRLSLDEVRTYLGGSLLPRLARESVVQLPPHEHLTADAEITIAPYMWAQVGAFREQLAQSLLVLGERPSGAVVAATVDAGHSLLEAKGLVKVYRRRKVVNDVALRLQQGEIVGLLGPNGAGKTTMFYMIVGLIPPLTGRIVLDGEDITEMPMYRRARRGIGYLSQEPSVFRKLSVEDNMLAILETLAALGEQPAPRSDSSSYWTS